MFLKQRLSIRAEVFYLGLIFSIITLLVFGILFSNSLSSISIDRAKNSIKETNMQISIFTEGLFTEITNTIEALAKNHDIIYAMTGDEEGIESVLTIFQDFHEANKNITYIYSGYKNGVLLINDYEPPSGFDATNRPWYVAAMEIRPKQSIGLPYQEANTNEWLISQSKALQDPQGNYHGVITIDCSLEEITGLLSKRYMYDSQRSFIMDQEGSIIIHSNESLIGEKVPEIITGITDRHGELAFTFDNRKVWAYYNTVDSTGWIVVTAVDRWEILNPIVTRISIYTLVVVFLAIALGIMQSKILGKRFAEPLIAMGNRLAAITEGKSRSKGNYQYSNPEIALIAENIEQLAEHSLNKKANELKTIIESTQDGILVTDENRQVIYVNSRFKELLGISRYIRPFSDANIFFNLIIEQLVDPHTCQAKVEELYASDRNDLDTLYFKDGRVFELFTCSLIDEGQIAGRLWSFRDITERKQSEEKLRMMATTDNLTGLWNRGYFMQALRREMARAQRYNQSFSVMILDIDYFKKVNDTLGHAAGDVTLQHLATIIKSNLRDVDILGRLGGEEFAILLPNSDLPSAVLLAERLRQAIEKSPAHYESGEIFVTVSIGVTAYREGISNIDDLLKKADEAMYEAKACSRNCIVQKM